MFQRLVRHPCGHKVIHLLHEERENFDAELSAKSARDCAMCRGRRVRDLLKQLKEIEPEIAASWEREYIVTSTSTPLPGAGADALDASFPRTFRRSVATATTRKRMNDE